MILKTANIHFIAALLLVSLILRQNGDLYENMEAIQENYSNRMEEWKRFIMSVYWINGFQYAPSYDSGLFIEMVSYCPRKNISFDNSMCFFSCVYWDKIFKFIISVCGFLFCS